MVGVVQADADELADPGDAGADPRSAVDQRQRRRIDLRQPRQRFRQQRVAADVRDDARQIADLATVIEQAGLFLSGGTISEQFHSLSSIR